MECQECQKRPATVHFTQVINGNKTEVHLCEYCAQEKGYMDYDKYNFSFHNLLSGLFNIDSGHSLAGDQSSGFSSHESLTCEKCGMSYHEFKHLGKFGCSKCYETFDDQLNPIFRRVHSGNTRHDGKIPRRAGGKLHLRKNIDHHRKQLQQLIDKEEFEEAARVRDQIRELENQLSDGKDGEA